MIEARKPRGYWTKELCKLEAKKYSTKKDFYSKSFTSYSISQKKGWLNECCSHMTEAKKHGYWTKERCKADALKYKTRGEYAKSLSYTKAHKKGWLNECCEHMVEVRKPHGFWTKDQCIEEAKKHPTYMDFKKKSSYAYEIALKNGWSETIKENFGEVRTPNDYWTYELCELEAKKYKHRSDFKYHCIGAYRSALKNHWLDEICIHMTAKGNKILRHVYSLTFSDGSIYIGLSGDYKRRFEQHKTNKSGVIYKYIQHIKEEPLFKLITPDLIPVEIARKMEIDLIEYYTNNGFKVLNIAKGGSIGGSTLIWTKEKCIEEALKYPTYIEFKRISSSAYSSARRNNWLKFIKVNFKEVRKSNGHWTKELCELEAKKYSTKKDFRLNSSGAYDVSQKKGWLNDICDHMVEIKKPSGYWNLEMCIEDAKKYPTYIEFTRKSSSAYGTASKNGWCEIIKENFEEVRRPNNYWTKELCELEAKKYPTYTEFYKKSFSAYEASLNNGWIKYIKDNFKEVKKPNGYWNLEMCTKEAKKHPTYLEFQKKSQSAYNSAKRNNWLDIIKRNFNKVKKPKEYWNLEMCIDEAKKYSTYMEFQKKSNSAYKKSLKNGWIKFIKDNFNEIK